MKKPAVPAKKALVLAVLPPLAIAGACALALAAAAMPARADGHGPGNGGDVVVCREPGKKTSKSQPSDIVSVELLDLYEGPQLYQFAPEFTGSRPAKPGEPAWKPYLERMAGRIQRFSPLRAKWLVGTFQEKFNTDRASLRKVVLTDIPDSEHVVLPENCRIEQLVNQRSAPLPNERTFAVNQDLFDRLPPAHQAATIAHEFFLREGLMYGHVNSVSARYLTSFFASAGSESASFGMAKFIRLLASAGYLATDIGPMTVRIATCGVPCAAGDAVMTGSVSWKEISEGKMGLSLTAPLFDWAGYQRRRLMGEAHDDGRLEHQIFESINPVGLQTDTMAFTLVGKTNMLAITPEKQGPVMGIWFDQADGVKNPIQYLFVETPSGPVVKEMRAPERAFGEERGVLPVSLQDAAHPCPVSLTKITRVGLDADRGVVQLQEMLTGKGADPAGLSISIIKEASTLKLVTQVEQVGDWSHVYDGEGADWLSFFPPRALIQCIGCVNRIEFDLDYSGEWRQNLEARKMVGDFIPALRLHLRDNTWLHGLRRDHATGRWSGTASPLSACGDGTSCRGLRLYDGQYSVAVFSTVTLDEHFDLIRLTTGDALAVKFADGRIVSVPAGSELLFTPADGSGSPSSFTPPTATKP